MRQLRAPSHSEFISRCRLIVLLLVCVRALQIILLVYHSRAHTHVAIVNSNERPSRSLLIMRQNTEVLEIMRIYSSRSERRPTPVAGRRATAAPLCSLVAACLDARHTTQVLLDALRRRCVFLARDDPQDEALINLFEFVSLTIAQPTD
jgi:hypothetical protein